MWHAAHRQTSTHPTHRPVPPSPNQSLAKHNRKPPQMIENKQQRPKSIASFCRVFCDSNGKSKGTHPAERDGRCTRSQILIASGANIKK